MANRWESNGNSVRLCFLVLQKSLQMVTAVVKLKDTCCLEENLDNLDNILKNRVIAPTTKLWAATHVDQVNRNFSISPLYNPHATIAAKPAIPMGTNGATLSFSGKLTSLIFIIWGKRNICVPWHSDWRLFRQPQDVSGSYRLVTSLLHLLSSWLLPDTQIHFLNAEFFTLLFHLHQETL